MIQIVEKFDELEALPKGSAIMFDIEKKSILFLCPGCGKLSCLGLNLDKSPNWEIVKANPITLTPSILHNIDKGGCGWHGYLRNAEFVSV